MSNRAFGVEIECYAPVGCDDEYEGACNGVDFSYELLVDHGYHSWANLVSADDSLYDGYGAEIKSPILVGEPGFTELRNVMGLLRSNDYYVDDSCGLHVHLNCPEWENNPKLIIKTVRSWMKNQELISNMVDPSRHNNDYCPVWYEDDFNSLKEDIEKNWFYIGDTLRGSINVGALSAHGSIEIRQHEGTLNYEDASSWIKFCQAFIDSMTGKEVRAISTEELLLKRLKVERNASRFISNKVRSNKARRGIA